MDPAGSLLAASGHRRREDVVERGEELLHVDRLRQRRRDAFDPPMMQRREDDDGNVRDVRIAELFLPERPAVDHRHHQIEQDHFRAEARPQQLERGLSVRRADRFVARSAQQLLHPSARRIFIFDDEHDVGHASDASNLPAHPPRAKMRAFSRPRTARTV
jgi:hypothetical protein